MFWRLLVALLLVAFVHTDRSVPEAEESSTSLLEEAEGQGPTTTSSISSVRKSGDAEEMKNSSHGDINSQESLNDDERVNLTSGEVNSDELFNVTSSLESNMTDIEVLNSTDVEMNIFNIHGNLSEVIMLINKSDDQLGLNSHYYKDSLILSKNSDEKLDESVFGGLNVSNNARNIDGNNGNEMKHFRKDQKGDEKLKGIQDKYENSAITDENLSTTVVKLNILDDQNMSVHLTLQNLLNNLTQTIEKHSSNSPLVIVPLKNLGTAIRNITLPDFLPYLEDQFTLGIFPSNLYNPAGGIYMGLKWEHWNNGVPRGDLIAVDEPLETSATLAEVFGITVDGFTFQRSALLASNWSTAEIYTLFYETHYFEHRRTIDAFFYDPKGDEIEVYVFWEPFSVSWKKVRCEVWVLGQGWDGGKCFRGMFGEGLVGCRCHGVTFNETGQRRARFMIVEESETEDTRADQMYLERTASYLHANEVNDNGLEDISNVIQKLISLKPDIFNIRYEENYELMVDVNAELYRRQLKNESVFLDITSAASLVVLEDKMPLDGLYLGKRWPTDNPDDAEFHAFGLGPGGFSMESTATDSEVFAVRIAGNVSLPHRTSLLLSSWEKNSLRRYFFKVVLFTQRFADLAFSAEDDAVEGDGIEILFETSTRDWTTIRCSTWHYDLVTWDANPCTSKRISSRLHFCNCPKALYKVGDLLRTSIHITEESINAQTLINWDLFNRTSHHLNYLSQISLPSDQLPKITKILDKYVLFKVRTNNYVIPSLVLDNLATILHRLVLDPNNSTSLNFSKQVDAKSTATLFVTDRVDNFLATVAISATDGQVWNSTQNDIAESKVAVSFEDPQNGVSRVAVSYLTTASLLKIEDRIIHRDKSMLDVTWRRNSTHPVSTNVIIHLKPFVNTKRPVTVRSKTCRSWNFDRHDWSDDCTIRLENSKELCQCKISFNNDSEIAHARFHIVSYWSEQIVVSTSVPFFLLLTSELTIQMLIFHTGCALSLFGLVTVFATALAFKSWRQRLSNKILLHICSALLLQILSVLFYYVVYHPFFFDFFDFLPEHREWMYLCLAMGVAWSYSYLARWCWMLVMSVLQLMRIVTVMGARNVTNLVLKVSIFAWGGPFIVLGYFLSDPWAYFDDFNRRFYFLTYLLPLSVVLLANLAVFATILARAFACCGWGKMADLERHGANSWASIWKRLRTVIVLFFTLEMTWLFELFIYFGYYNAFLHAMSFVVTAFHGFGTFLVFVVLDGDARAGWRAALRSWRSWRKMALLYCLVFAIIFIALVVVVVVAVLLVCLHTLA